MKKEYHISEFSNVTIYSGFTEMVLQEDYKYRTTGEYSELCFTYKRGEYYLCGDSGFVQVTVEGM